MTSHVENLIEECALRKSLKMFLDTDENYTDVELLQIIKGCATQGNPMPKGIGLQNDVCAYCSIERVYRMILKEIENRKQWLTLFAEKYEHARAADAQANDL